jgi:hypothetical protein
MELYLRLNPPSIEISTLNNKAEYVLIKNQGDDPVNLAGWVLHDHEHGKGHVFSYTFSDLTLKAGEILRMQSGKKADVGDTGKTTHHHYIHWADRKVWNDTCDIASLKDQTGALIAQKRGGKKPDKDPCK